MELTLRSSRGYDSLMLLENKSMVDGMDVSSKENLSRHCEGCVMGKQHRTYFPEKSESSKSRVLELIHSDVCGPMNINSVGSSRYFVTFIKTKDEVIHKFKEFVALVENFTGCFIKQFRSGNGGEYTSKEFD